MDAFSLLILFFLLASTLQPLLQARYQAMLQARQIAAIDAAIEKERGSRVIMMIHRQDTRSLFSVPVSRTIDLEDAQQIIPAIQSTPPAPLAYIAGSLGTLIGADLMNFNKLADLGAPILSIGGAGTFDGIFITGMAAVLIASIPSRHAGTMPKIS